nr:DeoR/GlpR family DNA-binding transcription regulator [uncultured Mediterraneibacter sp.]
MKRERAYVDARRNQILEIMKENPKVMVDELAERFRVSLITVRRDLQYLEDHNLLVRFHGGAQSVQSPDAAQQNEVNLYRRLIAQYAATLVEDGDSLFINTSRNALQMLEYVKNRNVTVITNNGKALRMEYNAGTSIILTGGEIRYPKEALVGDFAIRNVQQVFPKKAFIGCSGFSPLSGMTTEIAGEVKINELMIQNASQVYVLADHTKIGKNSSFTSSPLEGIGHLITDEKASRMILDEIRDAGVRIHQVRKGDFQT